MLSAFALTLAVLAAWYGSANADKAMAAKTQDFCVNAYLKPSHDNENSYGQAWCMAPQISFEVARIWAEGTHAICLHPNLGSEEEKCGPGGTKVEMRIRNPLGATQPSITNHSDVWNSVHGGLIFREPGATGSSAEFEEEAGGGGGSTPPSPQAPQAATGTVSGTEETRLTLSGSLNPRGSDTHYRFEYGETTGYGSTTASIDAGSGTEAVWEQAMIAGLRPGTVYHYRLIASNAGGTTYGEDQSAITTASTSGNPLPIRVSPTEVDSFRRAGNGTILGNASAGAGWGSAIPLPVNTGGAVGDLAALQNGSQSVQVYWRGSDGKIYGDNGTPGQGWQGPFILPTNAGGAAGSPSLVQVSSTEWDIYWRGSDGVIYGDVSAGAGWQGPYAISTNAGGAAGDPVTIQSAPGQIQIYWRGSDGKIYGDISTAGVWQGPFPLPTSAGGAVGNPSLVKVNAGEWDLYFRGANGTIYGDISAGAGWQGPYILPTSTGGAAGSPKAIQTGGQVQVYFRGSDGKIYGDLGTTGWQGPFPLPTNAGGAAGDPALIRVSASEWDAYWLDSNGSVYGDLSAGAGWQGPFALP